MRLCSDLILEPNGLCPCSSSLCVCPLPFPNICINSSVALRGPGARLLAGNLEQPVSHMSSTICLSPHNTFHHLGHAGVIYTVDTYIGWLHMYYGEPSRSLGQ